MTRKQRAGTIGMAGAVLWIAAILMEYRFGLQPPGGSGALYITNRILFWVALMGISLSLVGLVWGGAVRGRPGKVAVSLAVLGYAFIILGGILVLLTGHKNPLTPIGGLLSLVAVMFTGIFVAVEKHWSGWQRFMPLIHGAYLFLSTFLLVFFTDVTANGKGPLIMVSEIVWGVSWFFVGLAVYTAQEITRT